MADKLINIAFPLRGINRRPGFQWQPPYHTVDALNVVPTDAFQTRDRGGVRPGLTKYVAGAYSFTPRAMTIYTLFDGARHIVFVGDSVTTSSPVNGSGVTGGPFAGTISATRPQAVQFLSRVYVIGRGHTDYPYYYQIVGGTPSSAALVPTGAPSVAWPVGTRLTAIAVKYDRLWVAFPGDASGVTGLPSRFWASAVNDPDDFEDDRDEDDPTTAYSAELNSNRDAITAIIPWFGNYMLFATATSLYVLDGDPRANGIMRRCSDKLGIVDHSSWCLGESDSIIAMSNSGLILIPAGASPEPQMLMRDALPAVLTKPDIANYDHVLAYDSRSRRLHIFRSKLSASAGVDHYTLDLQEKTWWRYQFANTAHEPFAVLPLRELNSQRTDLLLACRDGYLRYFDESAATDDGTNISSYVWLGPFQGMNAFTTGLLEQFTVTMARDSGDVTISLHRGHSAEAAFNATAFWSRTFSAGRSPTRNPQMNFGACYMKITGTAGVRWAFENAAALVVSGGPLRV